MIQFIQLFLALSFLVIIHELGHFTFAKIFHVRVEKFYMFFNPQISLFRAKKFGGKWHFRFLAPNVEPSMVEKLDANGEPAVDRKGKPVYRPMTEQELAALDDDDWRKYPDSTEWGIGWLPFGGYCAIAGMVDETTSAGELASEPQPWEYRAKPTWQRLPIILGGVLVNFIAALIIYSAILFNWGEEYVPIQNAKYGMQYTQVLLDNGFEQGDLPLTINGKEIDTPSDFVEHLIIDGFTEVQVLRDGDTVLLSMPQDLGQQVLESGAKGLISFRVPFVIAEVSPASSAAKGLLQAGDTIVALNDTQTPWIDDVLTALPQFACDSVTITYKRNSETQTTRIYLGDEAKMGVAITPINQILQTRKIEYGFFESIPAGIKYGWNVLANYVKQFKLVFTKAGAKSLGGFVTIGSLFPKVWSWYLFWNMTAFLSIILAFMNIIPIPALDGGYVLFLIVEMITGKKPSDRFLEIANNIGFWILIALMIFANLNDILRLFGM